MARDIFVKWGQESRLCNVIAHFSGFCLSLSYKGTFNYIMNGSVVDKMLSDCAYARALWVHILMHAALTAVVLFEADISSDEQSKIEATY